MKTSTLNFSDRGAAAPPESFRPNWRLGAVQTAGKQHRENQTPCQDAALAGIIKARPFLIVCDGRGSSAVSHEGAQAAVKAFSRAVWKLEPLLADCLDRAKGKSAGAAWEKISSVLLRELTMEQKFLAKTHGRAARDFEFTLIGAIMGTRHFGWLQVGDSCLAVQRSNHLALVAAPQQGRYANETEFVSPCERTEAVALRGIEPTKGVLGLAAFSDGVALKLVNSATNKPAAGVGQIMDRLATGQWTSEHLQSYSLWVQYPEACFGLVGWDGEGWRAATSTRRTMFRC